MSDTSFCLIHVGNMPGLENSLLDEIVRRKVMPGLRDMWPEWKDDNRWWCKPMETASNPRLRSSKPGRTGGSRYEDS